jgi:hypothetical protein
MENLMTRQIQTIGFTAFAVRVLPVAMLLLVGMPTAEAKQCRAAMPSNPQGHWTYRLIDGRKCWYEGDSNISKSLLRWPAQAEARSVSSRADRRSNEKRARPVTQTVTPQAEKPDIRSGPETLLTDSDSFEARWRAVEITLPRN